MVAGNMEGRVEDSEGVSDRVCQAICVMRTVSSASGTRAFFRRLGEGFGPEVPFRPTWLRLFRQEPRSHGGPDWVFISRIGGDSEPFSATAASLPRCSSRAHAHGRCNTYKGVHSARDDSRISRAPPFYTSCESDRIPTRCHSPGPPLKHPGSSSIFCGSALQNTPSGILNRTTFK